MRDRDMLDFVVRQLGDIVAAHASAETLAAIVATGRSGREAFRRHAKVQAAQEVARRARAEIVAFIRTLGPSNYIYEPFS